MGGRSDAREENDSPKEEDEKHDEDDCAARSGLRFRALRVRAAGSFVFAPRCGQDRIHAASDAGIEIPGAELRPDLVIDDIIGRDVGDRSLQTIADLDPHLPILRKDEEDSPIILPLLAYAPRRRRALGEILELVVAGHGRVDGDDDLIRRLALVVGEFRIERAYGGWRKQSGLIVNVLRGLRRERVRRSSGQRADDEHQQTEQGEPGQSPASSAPEPVFAQRGCHAVTEWLAPESRTPVRETGRS